jgi:formate-dependent nitrite reductase membrane component NrfD
MGKNPAWSWYIVWYFFFGGVAAGAYFMAAVVDFLGGEEDGPVARAGYAIAFPLLLLCPLLLTLDLGMPVRTFNMFRLFKWGSPMSVGSWALLGFGLFSLLSLLLVFKEGEGSKAIRRVVAVPGGILGFFIASYTGVLLGATNRSIWGGNDWIGPLFLVSAVSTGVAAIALLLARRRGVREGIRRVDLTAIVIEALLLVVFLWSLGPAASVFINGVFAPLFWGGLVGVGLAVPFILQIVRTGAAGVEVATGLLVLVGGLALRYLVLMSGQT